jgi:hypothetical protein
MHDPANAAASSRADSAHAGLDAPPHDALRPLLADALRYWEPRRLVYNALLASIVVAVFAFKWTQLVQHASVDLFLGLFLLAVLANVVYCAAYLADLFVQRAGLREWRDRVRVVLFAVGLAFASVIAQFIARGIAEGG